MTEQLALSLPTAPDWYATMPAPVVVACTGEASRVSIRRYIDTPSEMRQPALRENIVCMHLGGAKEVRRWYDGRMDVHAVELGSVTIMPADQSNRWLTRGPIDFAHLMLSPELIEQIAAEEFNHSLAGLHFTDAVGFRDPHLEALFTALLRAVENRPGASALYLDSLIVVIVVQLLDRHSTLSKPTRSEPRAAAISRGGLAPWRLRRVIDYMHDRIGEDVGLADLSALTGLSRAQFFRAFRQSTGSTPHRYLTALRLDAAMAMLHQHDLEISEIGSALGLHNAASFGALFRQRFGLTPKSYRASIV